MTWCEEQENSGIGSWWEEQEMMADEDIRMGRFKTFDSVEELIEELKEVRDG